LTAVQKKKLAFQKIKMSLNHFAKEISLLLF